MALPLLRGSRGPCVPGVVRRRRRRSHHPPVPVACVAAAGAAASSAAAAVDALGRRPPRAPASPSRPVPLDGARGAASTHECMCVCALRTFSTPAPHRPAPLLCAAKYTKPLSRLSQHAVNAGRKGAMRDHPSTYPLQPVAGRGRESALARDAHRHGVERRRA